MDKYRKEKSNHRVYSQHQIVSFMCSHIETSAVAFFFKLYEENFSFLNRVKSTAQYRVASLTHLYGYFWYQNPKGKKAVCGKQFILIQTIAIVSLVSLNTHRNKNKWPHWPVIVLFPKELSATNMSLSNKRKTGATGCFNTQKWPFLLGFGQESNMTHSISLFILFVCFFNTH